jgi:hypothetical protein
MLGQPFQSGEITPPVRLLDPDPKRSAQRHHQERFCKVGVLAERLFQNPRQPTALPSDFVRYGILPRMRRDLARRPSGKRHNGRLAWDRYWLAVSSSKAPVFGTALTRPAG